MYEDHELKTVLSARDTRVKTKQTCDFCNRPLPPGTRCNSYGVIDRVNGSWKRIYFCLDHGGILDSMNSEDLSMYQQEYLFNKGFLNEIYGG